MPRYEIHYNPKTIPPMAVFDEVIKLRKVRPYLHNVSLGLIGVRINKNNRDSIRAIERIILDCEQTFS